MPIPQPLTGLPNMDYLYLSLLIKKQWHFLIDSGGLKLWFDREGGGERNVEINIIFSMVGFCSRLCKWKILWDIGSGLILWYRFFQLTAYWHSAILYQINCHKFFVVFVILPHRRNLVLSGNYLDHSSTIVLAANHGCEWMKYKAYYYLS